MSSGMREVEVREVVVDVKTRVCEILSITTVSESEVRKTDVLSKVEMREVEIEVKNVWEIFEFSKKYVFLVYFFKNF